MSRYDVTRLCGAFMIIAFFGAIVGVQASSNRTALNSIYVEGLGPGLVYSLNYERLVINDLGVRVGFSYMSFSASATGSAGETNTSVSFITFPIIASYLGISSGKHVLELGGGTTIISASGSATSEGYKSSGSGIGAVGDILIGYRIHPVNGGFQFRVGLCGMIGAGGFQPWVYLSLGGCF